MSVLAPAATDPLKLWILTAFVEGKRCLSALGSRNADHVMNMGFPRVPRSDLLDAMLELLEEDLIFVVERGRRERPDPRRLFRWLFQGKWRRHEPHGGLTRVGGLVWEHACRANWRRFVTNSMVRYKFTDEGDLGDCTVNFEGSNADRVRLYSLAYARGDHEINAFRWRRLTSWKATYWKTLPEGCRLTCDFKKVDFNPYRNKGCGHLWDLGRWYEDPPRAYTRQNLAPVAPCHERWSC